MPDAGPTYLPRASEAWIPEAKLRDYALSPDHTSGRHKARVFRAALGLAVGDWEYLRDQILQRVGRCPVTKVTPRPPRAVQYEVVISIDGRNGESRPVVTAWFVLDGGPPRLTTAYVAALRRRP